MQKIIVLLLLSQSLLSFSQKQAVSINDPEAAALLQKVSDKYKSYKSIEADFTLTTIRPKLKPDEPDSKYTDEQTGRIYLKGNKFKISLSGHEIICDGKNIWTYTLNTKEAQVNYYEDNDEIFSPTKIFTIYKEGYSYQVKEKKVFQGKNITIIEMSPSNRKVSFFKIDVGVDVASANVLESKIYEKSGTRYIYKVNKLNSSVTLSDEFFSFDVKKFPGVNVVDLR
jgi:outer membrane lipoprotein-sorting protein